MNQDFEEPVFREIEHSFTSGNVIKADAIEITGLTKICIDEEEHEGVKLVIKKDASNNIKEIKFICSCGHTKSIILNYTEE